MSFSVAAVVFGRSTEKWLIIRSIDQIKGKPIFPALGLDEAQRAVAALDPDMTISRYLGHVRFARAENARHLAAGLAAAGVPA